MTRRPPEPRLWKAKSRMAPGGRLRSESPVREPLPRVRRMGFATIVVDPPLRWQDYPHGLGSTWAHYPAGYRWGTHPTGYTWADSLGAGYTWADHPTGTTWADLNTYADLEVTP